MILVGDIGGTNTTIATIEVRDGRFRVVNTRRYWSAELAGISDALDDFIATVGRSGPPVEVCCLSGAGPVRNNSCSMTNVRWTIDGNEVAAALGIRTFVINDFSAICYALPLMDTHPEIKTVAIPHPDGSLPPPSGVVRAVVGAGTGLGTGYLIEDRGHFTAHPSEAGHSAFAPQDDEMDALRAYLAPRFAIRAGAEQYVSGQGIRNIYRCFREAGRIPDDAAVLAIDQLHDHEIPSAVGEQAANHEGLASVMRLFVRMYAHYASNISLCLLPSAGLYLAGGIAAKNERWILEDNLFMRTFEQNYNQGVTPLLRSTPVILIKDYSVSLYGAAHAAVSLA